MTDFDAIIPTAQDFYTRLSANNTKAWWQDNKDEFDTTLKAPAKALMADVSARLSTLYDAPFKTKMFRPNRDVRFSKDKTPYQTHLHLAWSLSDAQAGPGWFFGVSPDYIRIGWGWMEFSSSQVGTWRDAVTLTKIPALLDATGAQLSKPELKRVPPGFDKDHAQADHLRRKSLALWVDATPTGIVDQMMAHFEAVKPAHAELTPLLV